MDEAINNLKDEVVRLAEAIMLIKKFNIYEDEHGKICNCCNNDVELHIETFKTLLNRATERLILHKILGPRKEE